MNIRPFFRETADNGPTLKTLAQLARVAVAAEKLSRDAINVDVPKEKLTPERLATLDQFIADGIQPSLLKIGPISLAPSTEAGKSSGLTFHYSPYAVGAYAEGPYTVFVPWTAFQAHAVAARRGAVRRAASRKRQYSGELIGMACRSASRSRGRCEHAQVHSATGRRRAECAAVRLLHLGRAEVSHLVGGRRRSGPAGATSCPRVSEKANSASNGQSR